MHQIQNIIILNELKDFMDYFMLFELYMKRRHFLFIFNMRQKKKKHLKNV